ncbi:hypothetical protein [Burkholderia guangdongensis]|uniref:hypothetical protein n=1 Tax=Burkholderia guangdongensis TaxID=1792500 RepID=UPI0015CBE027|nr:hypothetical protein [Burkholderia guangdongensis]
MVIVMLAAANSGIALAQSNGDTLLDCEGRMTWEGHNAPKDVEIPAPSSVVGRFTLAGDTLQPSSLGSYPARKLILCESTSDSYTFSNDCTANPLTYVAEWLRETNINTETSPFFKRHQNSMFDLDVIRIDRVNLNLVETYYANDTHSDWNGASVKHTQYVVSSQFVATCRVVKPKI